MNEMQIFNYGESEVRTLLIDDNPWWVLRDVCAVLELGSPHKVAARLDEDERTLSPVIDAYGRTQKTTIINESGLYTVILRSDKAEAKAFKRWVTHEVLPAIRKTGKYENPATELGTQSSVEASLQRAGLILRAAEHRAVPQSEQLRLLDIAVRDLTGTGLNLSPAPVQARNMMDLPEANNVCKKGKTVRGRGYKVELLTLTEIADRVGATPSEIDNLSNLLGLKTGAYGEWVRVETPMGEAREFLYSSSAVSLLREEVQKCD